MRELTESPNRGIAESQNGLSRLRDCATARLRDQRGSALAVVLVLVVLLTVAGVAMVNSTLTETSIAYNQSDSAAAQYAAEAGLSRAMYELSQNAGWTGTTAAIGDGQYVVAVTSSGSVRSITSTGTRGGGRGVLGAAVKAVPQSATSTVLANTTATIGSGTAGLTVSNDFPSSAASAVQANNKLVAPTAITVNTTGANIIGGLTANGTISGVTCASWAWTCNASASVRAIPEIDMDSAATTSLKYRAQHTFDADGKYLYFKGGDTGRCNSGGAWTFDTSHTQQCWDYYVNSKSGTLGSGISNPVFFVEFNASEATTYTTGGGGGGSITTNLPIVIRGRVYGGTTGSTLTITKPTGVVSGDLLIAAISVRAAAPATPSGWTLVWCQYSSSGSGSGGSTCPSGTPTVSLAVYRKVAGASEPASYSWTVASKAAGVITAYYNVDTTNPLDVTAQCTLSAAASTGATSLSVVSGCTLGTGDSIKVGTNTTVNTVSSVSGTTLTISPGLGSGQSSGAAVVPQNGLSQTSSSGTSLSTPSITTHVANTMLVASFADGNGITSFGTTTPGVGIPAGMTEEWSTNSGGTPTTSTADAGIFDAIQDAVAATGQKTVTITTAAVGVAHLLALRPQTATVATSSGGSAPTFRAAASNTGSPLTISKPAGVVDGDVMIANIAAVTTTGTVQAPAGWTLIRRTTSDTAIDPSGSAGYLEQDIYYRVAAGEGASYTWTLTASGSMAGGIAAYSGVDTTNPVDAENAVWTPLVQSAANVSFPAPSVVTTNANDMLVASFIAWTTGSPPPALITPSGMTGRYSTSGSNALGADTVMVTPGSTTAIRATAGASSRGRAIGHLPALKPPGGTTVSCPGYTSAVETLCIRATAATPYPNSVLTQVTGAIVVFRCTLATPPCYGSGSSATVKGDIAFQNIASANSIYTHSSLTGDPALFAAGKIFMINSVASGSRTSTSIIGIVYSFAGCDNPDGSHYLQGAGNGTCPADIGGFDLQHGANTIVLTISGILASNGSISLQDTGGTGSATVRYDSTVANTLPAAFTASTTNYILIPISWSSGD